MDKLFRLHPGFSDNDRLPAGQTFYCPYSAIIEGVLAYFPDLRSQLEVHYVGFQKPRKQIVEMMGEENQGCPLLITEECSIGMNSIPLKRHNDHLFSNSVNDIAQYLSIKFQKPLPHF